MALLTPVNRLHAANRRVPGGGGWTSEVSALNGLRSNEAIWVRSHKNPREEPMTNLATIATETAERIPDDIAYKLDDLEINWAAVNEGSARVAGLLKAKGLE